MKYTLRFLLLGALLYVSGSACLAQEPFDYYMFVAFACSPTDCSNDQGPVFTGGVTIDVFGECNDGEFPDVTQGVYADNCSIAVELTTYGDSVQQTYIDDNQEVFIMDGVRAQAWSKEYYSNLQLWYGYTAQWCDGGIEGWGPPLSPC